MNDENKDDAPSATGALRVLPTINPDVTEDEPAESQSNAPVAKPTVSDPLEPDGGSRSNSSQAAQFAAMARWHLAMRLFHDVATSMNLDKNDGERMRLFEQQHPHLFRLCFGIDLFFTTCCVLFTIGAMGFAFARVTGLTVPWW